MLPVARIGGNHEPAAGDRREHTGTCAPPPRRPVRSFGRSVAGVSFEYDLFVYVYVLIHDWMLAGSITVPPRPGPAPACSDAELLAMAEVRHLLGRRSEAGSTRCRVAAIPYTRRQSSTMQAPQASEGLTAHPDA